LVEAADYIDWLEDQLKVSRSRVQELEQRIHRWREGRGWNRQQLTDANDQVGRLEAQVGPLRSRVQELEQRIHGTGEQSKETQRRLVEAVAETERVERAHVSCGPRIEMLRAVLQDVHEAHTRLYARWEGIVREKEARARDAIVMLDQPRDATARLVEQAETLQAETGRIVSEVLGQETKDETATESNV
jgi:chromosome segregation ATPase